MEPLKILYTKNFTVMKKYIGIITIVLVVAAMILLLVNNKRKAQEQTSAIASEQEKIAVETYTVSEETYSIAFSSNGILQAENELNYVSDVSGRVVQICVDKGDNVAKGDILLKTDTELFQNCCAYLAWQKLCLLVNVKEKFK